MIINKFTANLQSQDLENFIHEKCVELNLTQVPTDREKNSYVRYQGQWYGPCPEFEFDDFSFVGMNTYSFYDLSKAWRKFMFKQFGEEYKTSLEEYANKQRDELVNSLS